MSDDPLLHPALRELLLALADDEFITGYANSEWTGIAPMLEEDLAFSSLAQDEIGHARVFYELLAQIEGCTPDSLAYGREPAGFRHCRLVERPRGDWAYSVSRQFLYDTADFVRLDSLRGSIYRPLAEAAASIIREEKYHLLHANTWLHRLAEGSSEARTRQRSAFRALWADALAFFEPVEGEPGLVAAGIMPDPTHALQSRWLAQIAEPVRRCGLPFPFVEAGDSWVAEVEPAVGGRRGLHSQSFLDFYDTMTSVYRDDPGATW